MKPTNDEIVEYLLDLMDNLDGDGLTITDMALLKKCLELNSFQWLRELFNQ